MQGLIVYDLLLLNIYCFKGCILLYTLDSIHLCDFLVLVYRDMLDEVLEMGMESAQIQIKLK